MNSPSGSDNIMVITRNRPFNQREIELKTFNCVKMIAGPAGDQKIQLTDPKDMNGTPRAFTFDYCFDSSAPGTKDFVGQKQIFDSVGLDIIAKAWQGFNSTIFAYVARYYSTPRPPAPRK